MAKRIIQKAVEFCDVCNKEANCWVYCMNCGKTVCFGCKDIAIVEYAHSVIFVGSGDGHYCTKCDELLAERNDSLHKAYQQIQQLRKEREDFYNDFEGRRHNVENLIKQLLQVVN